MPGNIVGGDSMPISEQPFQLSLNIPLAECTQWTQWELVADKVFKPRGLLVYRAELMGV